MQMVLALSLFVVAFAGLALGVIFTGQRGVLKGSCGGVGSNPDCCQTCPDREDCDDAPNDHPLLAQMTD